MKRYVVRAFVDQAKVIELNERITVDPMILINNPEEDGYLAVIQMNYTENGGAINNAMTRLNAHGPNVMN